MMFYINFYSLGIIDWPDCDSLMANHKCNFLMCPKPKLWLFNESDYELMLCSEEKAHL